VSQTLCVGSQKNEISSLKFSIFDTLTSKKCHF
jgi:hypothetical protein